MGMRYDERAELERARVRELEEFLEYITRLSAWLTRMWPSRTERSKP